MDESLSSCNDLVAKIQVGEAKVGIIGLGYVGLPLVREFCSAGHPVIGFDTDPEKVDLLSAGKSYIHHIPDSLIHDLVDSGRFEATADFARLPEIDCIVICVPTPLTRHRQPDTSYVEKTADTISQWLRPGQLVVLESTTYPGTTEEILLTRLESGGLKVEEDFLLAYSPEREDPGNKNFTTRKIPKVVGGTGPFSLQAATCLYEKVVVEVVSVSSTATAEATKILENIYRCVNIALINELKVLFDRMGIDVWEVVEAAKTKPFGFQPFYPGPGLGGHCIPIDPFYLTWKAREYGASTRFIELAGEVNTSMPTFVLSKVSDALNQDRKPMSGSDILVLGVAYKPDVDDIRESPALELIEGLLAAGAQVEYHDPYIPNFPSMRAYDLKMSSVDLSADRLSSADCVLICTDHSDYDWSFIGEKANLIVDTRGVMRRLGTSVRARVVRA
jgi:UDP-N-acetyl-D-glucosamine dehydrogenase